MRKIMFLCVLILGSTLSAAAQDDYPRAEAFFGYSYIHFRASDSGETVTSGLHGGVGQVTFNATSMFGLVGEFGGHRISHISGTDGTDTFSGNVNGSAYTYLFGPRISFRTMRVNPFVQALFGGARLSSLTSTDPDFCGSDPSCTLTSSSNGFAMTIGGGLDVKATNHISIRLGQVDYLLTRFNFESGSTMPHQNNFRYSAGIVIH